MQWPKGRMLEVWFVDNKRSAEGTGKGPCPLSWEPCFQGSQPAFSGNDPALALRRSLCSPLAVTQSHGSSLEMSGHAYPASSLRKTFPPEWGDGRDSSQAGAKLRSPATFFKVTLVLFLILNNLNIEFPNPSRECFENMKGTHVSIKREQRRPKAVSFQLSRFRGVPASNGCL